MNLLEFSTVDTAADTQNNTAIKENRLPSNLNENLTISSNDDDKTHKNTFDVIPRFYHKLPRSNDALAQKLREEARTLFLQKRSRELLDNNELKTLWNILQKNYTPPVINNEHFIDYDDFLRVVKISGDKFK